MGRSIFSARTFGQHMGCCANEREIDIMPGSAMFFSLRFFAERSRETAGKEWCFVHARTVRNNEFRFQPTGGHSVRQRPVRPTGILRNQALLLTYE